MGRILHPAQQGEQRAEPGNGQHSPIEQQQPAWQKHRSPVPADVAGDCPESPRRHTNWRTRLEACSRSGGSWKSPKHTTPETLSLTESPLRPKIGITGLLNLLAWVEQKRVAHAAQQKEGGVPCPAPHPSQFPPAHVQATQHPVGAVTPSQSPALTRAPKPLTRTPARAAKRPRQGGQR